LPHHAGHRARPHGGAGQARQERGRRGRCQALCRSRRQMGTERACEQELHPRGLSLARRQGRGEEAAAQADPASELEMKELIGIAEQVATKLIARKQTIAVAESSTGGLIAASLLAVPGASAYFLGGAVVYTRDARRVLMDIADETMKG